MKRLYQRLIDWLSSSDTYGCIWPFATILLLEKCKAQAKYDYDALQHMISINDDVYKKLVSMQFKNNDATLDIRTTIDRARVCPSAIDNGTVEIDAALHMDEQFQSLQSIFSMYGLTDRIKCIASYLPKQDIILYRMRPTILDNIEDMQKFVKVNNMATMLWLVIFALIALLVLSFIIF